MKLLRMKTLGLFGIGFLAGSKAGHGPWEKAQQGMDQIKGKVSGVTGSNIGGGNGSTSTNGFNSPKSEATPQLTEM
jgi:hypothetical protein